MSYEQVPDVECGSEAGLPPSVILIAKAKERYPEAGTDIEAEFLGRLDDAVENCRPRISIPRLELGQPDSTVGKGSNDLLPLVKSLKLPTTALALTLTSALVVILTGNPLLRVIYPYYACVVTFSASIPAIRQRFLGAIGPVLEKFTNMKETIERELTKVSDIGLSYLDITESSMNRALGPINQKLAAVTKLETMLQKVDPTIDIPDTSDIGKSFDGYEQQIKTAFAGLQDAVDASHSLPQPLQSVSKFQVYIIVPFLVAMLVLQLLAVYHSNPGNQETDALLGGVSNNVAGVVRALTSTEETDEWFLEDTVNLISNTNDTVVAVDGENYEHQWRLVWIAIQSYLATVLQIAVAFLLTQARVIIGFANVCIASTERDINGQLKKAVGDVFEDIFQKGFGEVKDKFLTLVRKMDRLEDPVRKVKANLPGGNLLSGLGI